MATEPSSEDDLASALTSGDMRSLARAITLVESTRSDHRVRSSALLDELLPRTGRAVRLGVSGVPGAGKSTLIEALGMHAIEAGHQVAVLAIDPSSSVTGGSILGDKTRMVELARHPHAFVRPSPSGGTVGGVARRTREAMLLCEAAGFDLVIIETVGVGQSEVAVSELVDLVLLVASPAGGDELQGIKRGIMEIADLIVVNKADGELEHPANQSAAELRHAVGLLRPRRPGWDTGVLLASALTGRGIPELWSALQEAHERLEGDGLSELRARQNVAWMWSEVTDELLHALHSHPSVQEQLPSLELDVAEGRRSPRSAAQDVLARFGMPGSTHG